MTTDAEMFCMEQISKKRVFSYFMCIAVVVILLLGSCSRATIRPEKEILRVPSPDSVVDAILTEGAGNATASNAYFLYIVPKGGKFEVGYELLIVDHVEGLKIFWRQDRFLVIDYAKGRIFKFTNFWESKEVQNARYVVELRLVPKTNAFSLSDEDRRLKY